MKVGVNIAFDVETRGASVTFGPMVVFHGEDIGSPPGPRLAEGTRIDVLVEGQWLPATVERLGQSAVLDGMPARGRGLIPLAFDDYDIEIGCCPWRLRDPT